MTKVSIEGTDSPIKKRAPRKRAIRRVASNDEKPVRRVRTSSSVSSTSVADRKAPSRIEYKEKKKTSPKPIWIGVFVLLLIFAGAAWVGISDAGQINVNAKINEMNQRLSDQATDLANQGDGVDVPRTIVVPVQDTAPTVPNGGFRGRGVMSSDANQAPAPVVEEGLSSSTDSIEGENTEEEVVAEETAAEAETAPEEFDENAVPELTQ